MKRYSQTNAHLIHFVGWLDIVKESRGAVNISRHKGNKKQRTSQSIHRLCLSSMLQMRTTRSLDTVPLQCSYKENMPQSRKVEKRNEKVQFAYACITVVLCAIK